MAKNIVNLTVDGSSYIHRPFGTCDTAAGTAAKVVSCTDFTLATGATILVKFTNANSASSPTLNVNGTGAKNVYYRGAALASSLYYWGAKDIVEFYYDGTQWNLLDVSNSNTTYSSLKNPKAITIQGNGTTSFTYDGSAAKTLNIKAGSNITIGSDTSGNITINGTANTTYSAMTGATSSAAGKSGLVPAPAAGNQSKFLRGDGTWVTPTNTTYSVVGAKDSTGLVKNGSSVTDASGYTACPIVGGIPYYKDTNTTYSLSSLGIGNVKNYDQSKAITTITRSGTTFTYTCLDGTTGTFTQQDNNTTYSAGTGISISSNKITNTGVRAVATGSANGTISVNTNGTAADVAVKGLGSAAYTASSAYAPAEHTHSYAGSSSAGGAATSANKVNSSLTLKIKSGSTEGTDLYTFNGSAAKTLDIKAGSNITLTAAAGSLTIAATNTTYSAGTGISLSSGAFSLATSGVTKGSYGPSANASPSHSGTFSVPYLTVDKYGRVTAVSTKTITLPASGNTDTKVSISAVAPTSATSYYPTMYTATSGTGVTLSGNGGIVSTILKGTTSAAGYNILTLGNSTATGTANNMYGALRLYSEKSSYHQLKGANTTSAITHTLPATTGIILNSGTTSFTQTLTSGIKIGAIKINGTSKDIYGVSKISQLENDANYIQDDVIANGVYAVTTDDQLIDYHNADANCIGVAIIAGSRRFMIPKIDAPLTFTDPSAFYYIHENIDLPLINYSTVDGTNGGGNTIEEDNSSVSSDFTTWTEGALSDFNGRKNTEIITSSFDYSSDDSIYMEDMGFAISIFNRSNEHSSMVSGNEGKHDWYIPSCGQLGIMSLFFNEINEALSNIGGNALQEGTFYWSSTEHDESSAWGIQLSDRMIDIDDKDAEHYIRYVRDLSITVRERISTLEINKADRIPIIDYQTTGGAYELVPNVYYKWGNVSSLTLTLANPIANIYNEYMFEFVSGSSATSLTLPNTVKWVSTPNIEINKTYQCSIVNNIGILIGV